MSFFKSLTGSELGRSILSFKREFVWVGVFSFFANILMLAPTLYMLQVFDRVMLSQNEFTLISLTLITTFLFAIMAFSEWVRSRLLVRAGVRFDEFLNSFLDGARHGVESGPKLPQLVFAFLDRRGT